MSDGDQIRALLNRINGAWTQPRHEEIGPALSECFDDAMVIRGGEKLEEAARGKDACVASYVDFIRMATVRECRISEPAIDQWGDVAIATYSWDIDYTLEGKRYREKGRDAFLLKKSAGAWRALWRAMLPERSSATS